MRKNDIPVILFLIFGLTLFPLLYLLFLEVTKDKNVLGYESCVSSGGIIHEATPPTCSLRGDVFTQ